MFGLGSPDWVDLQLFLRVARAGSFTKAADGTPLTQPTISRRISTLEDQLKVKLFHRGKRGVLLTSAGQAIVGLAAEMDREARLVEPRATQETDLSEPIRLWLTDGIGGYWLPPRMTEFHRLFPAI